MKKLIIFSTLIFVSFSVMSQNLHITFTGAGESTIVDSVNATNLSTEESITLPGNERLILSTGTGINDLNYLQSEAILYPNPFQKTASLTFYQTHSENVVISIRNLIGQLADQSTHYLEAGEHSFMISLTKPGIYLIDITGKTDRSCIKAICTESGTGLASIAYSGISDLFGNTNQSNRNKSHQIEYRLAYTIGDIIHFKAMGGKYTSIITDSPETAKTYEIEFVDCTDSDDRTYAIVEIGDQVWMAENLAYLPAVSPASVESYTDKYYYVYDYNGTSISEAKATDNYDDYGVLYNWEAAKAACPTGWYLPSAWEWLDLANYVGGYGVAGKKLKSTSGWNNNGNGNNNSGFNGLPGGSCSTYSGFKDIGSWGEFWTSSPDGSYNADGRGFGDQYDVLVNVKAGRTVGLSVRCIKDE